MVTCTCIRSCAEWHYKVGQNSKQEKSQWQLLARTASDAANYANELISAVERTDKTKWPLFNHSWGLLKWRSQIYNACSNIHSVHVCAVHVQSKHHLKERLVSLGWQWWLWSDRWQSERPPNSFLPPRPDTDGLLYVDLRGIWRLVLQLQIWRDLLCSVLLVPQNSNYTAQRSVCGLWSLQSKGKKWAGATSAASTFGALLIWNFCTFLRLIYNFCILEKFCEYYINEMVP